MLSDKKFEELRKIGSDYYQVLQELVERLESGEEEEAEQALEELNNMPLEVCYRSGWETHRTELEPAEVYVLLTTGGPAVRIVGEWNPELETMESPVLQVQDWGTAWTDYYEAGIRETLDKVVSYFFGYCIL